MVTDPGVGRKRTAGSGCAPRGPKYNGRTGVDAVTGGSYLPQMPLSDLHAVVASARARGTGSLERLVAARDPDLGEAGIEEKVRQAVQIIEEVPSLLERAAERARKRGLASAIGPILDRGGEYLLRPVDLMPEMTQGLAGLVDDAYFVLCLLHSLEQGPDPLLEEDFTGRLDFLRGLTGEDVARRIDHLSAQTLLETETRLSEDWEKGAAEA